MLLARRGLVLMIMPGLATFAITIGTSAEYDGEAPTLKGWILPPTCSPRSQNTQAAKSIACSNLVALYREKPLALSKLR
jgi:hypothetical protein